MIQFIKITNQLNEWMGKAANWVATFLVLLICLDVSMRYIFKFSSVAVYELEWHLFSIIFLFGAGYTLKKDKHVRVDIFYAKMSPQKKAIVNLLGYLLFLIPFCIIIMKGCIPYIKVSYLMHEKSTDPGGLPMRYVSKSLIMIGFFFLLMQGIAQTFQSILYLMGKKVE
jgi:TRAP-type mannitol/chloroaromatic compound transport system permease small subunit